MRRILAGLFATALCVFGTTAFAAPAGAPAQRVGRPALAPAGSNLLLNPGAETGLCTTSGFDAMTVPGWTVTEGASDSVCYGSVGFPRPDVPGPDDRGRAFFSGGATGDASMSQRVDVSSATSAIDRGGVGYQLDGWLGGWAGQNDRVGVRATFLDGSGVALATAWLVPVTNTDRDGVTGLLFRASAGRVPPLTRTVLVTVTDLWTAGNTTDGYADNLGLRLSVPVTAPRLVPPPSVVPTFDHVFFVFMENENAMSHEVPLGTGHYIVGNPAARYLNATIAPQGSLLIQLYATTHPSDPNYLAVSGGSTFGWVTNPVVGTDMIDAPHLGDRLEAAGRSWKAYAGGSLGNCDLTEHNTAAGGWYLPDDQPFMLYKDVATDRARCVAHDQPLSAFAGDLRSTATTPDFVWFAANDVDNMEEGGVAAGDAWLGRVLPQIFNSPAWTDQRSLLIVSWDEGHTKAFGPEYPNHVAAYVLASQGMVKQGYVSPVRYTDYSLGRTIEEALNIPPLTSNDMYALPLGDVWAARSKSGGSGGATTSLRTAR
ncbi:MAG TPA: alkaline phosphatase family protein [Micromonosporaceae bacterium]|nr:alkaline phosphatase family protein [Micromonosporaceae bacterium]